MTTEPLPHRREPDARDPDICTDCGEPWADLSPGECPARLRTALDALTAPPDEERERAIAAKAETLDAANRDLTHCPPYLYVAAQDARSAAESAILHSAPEDLRYLLTQLAAARAERDTLRREVEGMRAQAAREDYARRKWWREYPTLPPLDVALDDKSVFHEGNGTEDDPPIRVCDLASHMAAVSMAEFARTAALGGPDGDR